MFWLWPLKERAIPYNLLFFTVPHRVGTQKICNKMIEIVIVTPSWISEIQSILQMAQGNVGDYLKSICFEIFPMLFSLSQLLQTWFLETFQILVSSSAIHQKYLFLLENREYWTLHQAVDMATEAFTIQKKMTIADQNWDFPEQTKPPKSCKEN